MKSTNSSLLVILGPTGSGKSTLALFLAGQFGGEIVNCDSVQVYRGLDIGSAKTPVSERGGVPHYLLDIVEPDGELTAGAYAERARSVLAEISARNRLPIVAGGTGFYLRSLLDGLSPAAGRDPKLRDRLNSFALRRPAALHRLLRQRDPKAAGRIHPNDHQKLIRAIELSADAEPLPPRVPLSGYSVLKIGLNPPRAELYGRINERCAGMFAHGLIEETQALLDAGVPPDAKSLHALGYKQAVRVLTRQTTLGDALADCQTKTRQYAKRQLTWFRRESGVHWLDGFGTSDQIRAEAAEIVKLRLTGSSR